MLLTEASLLHQLAQINPGRGTGESIVSELATAGSPASTNATPGGFDWSDAAVGFGAGAFGAALLGTAVFTARRRGTLVHVP